MTNNISNAAQEVEPKKMADLTQVHKAIANSAAKLSDSLGNPVSTGEKLESVEGLCNSLWPIIEESYRDNDTALHHAFNGLNLIEAALTQNIAGVNSAAIIQPLEDVDN